MLFLAHRAADVVRLAQREARQAAEDLYYLFLVHNAAVGDGENGLERGVPVAYLLRVLAVFDEARYGVHGAGAVEGYDGRYVLDALGAQAGTDAGHARALELEHALGFARGEHGEGLRVVVRERVHVEVRRVPAHQLGRVFQHGEVPQAEEVHLQQAKFLERGHGVLRDYALVVLCQRDVFVHRPLGYHHAGGVCAGVSGHALQLPGRVDEGVHALVAAVHVAQLLGEVQRLGERHARSKGHLFGHGVALGVAYVQRAARVAHGLAGGHGAEGDYLRHVVAAVLAVDVLNDLAAAAHAEVYVYVRHAHALGVQEALKVEAVLYGVHVGYVQAVADHAAGGAAAPRPDGDALALGIAYEVGDDEEVVHKAHAPDHVQLIVELGPGVPALGAVAAGKACGT